MSIIDDIIDIEHKMFMSVNTEEEAECRNHSAEFRFHRGVQFSAWSHESLESYLDDLKTAVKDNRNLMTYKYARMDNLIPSENEDPLVKKILDIQIVWQLEMVEKYPELMKNARGVTSAESSPLSVSFARYLSAELESYSAATLKLLYSDILRYKEQKINMSERIYLELTSRLGLDSIDAFRAG